MSHRSEVDQSTNGLEFHEYWKLPVWLFTMVALPVSIILLVLIAWKVMLWIGIGPIIAVILFSPILLIALD